MIIQHVECPTCGRVKQYEVQERPEDCLFRLMFGGKLVEDEWYVEECHSCESDYDEYLFALARGEEVEEFNDEEDALPF